MVRKKNKMFVDSADRTPHYSLRKLSVGVASVLLSTTLWMGANGSVAHADTVNDAQVDAVAQNQQKAPQAPEKESDASTDTTDTGADVDNSVGGENKLTKQDAKTYATKQEASDDLDGKNSDLSSLASRAEKDGLTVTKEHAKTYATKKDALDDLDKQVADIQGQVTKYKAEKAAYDTAKKVYDEDLKKWNDAQSPTNPDPHMVKGISQGLSFANEHDASLDVTSGSDKPVHFIKSSAWLGNDGQGVYTDGMFNGGNISKSFSKSDITSSQAEGTGPDSRVKEGWGKTYTGVQLKLGESAVARYTGLKNSVYIDKAGVAHKLSKAQVKYTLNETTANDGTANIFLSNNPNIALWYGAAGGQSNGRVDLTIDLTFYDENGKPITLSKDSNAWLDMSSLNNGTTKVEYFAPNGNPTVQIPGSSIKNHADGWYADNNNEVQHAGWDNPASADRYYGAAIMELDGNSFHIGQKITKYNPKLTNSRNVYSWFALDSSLATAHKPVEPKVPDKPIIAWHGVTYEPQKATVTYIDDTDDKTTLKSKSLEGDSNADSKYNTKSSIQDYENKGYVLVSDDTNGQNVVFDNDSNNDQIYEVHLKHGTESKQDETTVKETIHYNYADGSKAAEDHSDSVTLSRTGTKDKVTGHTDWNAWSKDEISSVTSPTIPGYTADKKEIGVKLVNGPHDEFVEMVTYKADTQKATVTYIDDTANTTLKSDSLEGDSNSVASFKDGTPYTTGSSIDDYKNQGYELVSDSTGGKQLTFDHDSSKDQQYVVHLKHGTVTVTPGDKTPVKPGDKINPKDPNSPEYKDDVKHDNLTKDAKQTVHYEGAGTDTPADSVTTRKDAFTRAVTYDKVTGESTTSDWSQPKTTFDKVDTPVVKGYTADKKQAGGLTATPDHPEVKDTVIYTPNGSIVPVDPDGNPIPNTPSVPYETDPHDPTNVVKGKVPEVPGWTPKNGDPVKPSDPTQDTYVPYDHTMTPGETKVAGKQTVTYVYKDKNGKTVKTKTVEQDTIFTGKTSKDEVTGKTTTTWDQKDHKYTAVKTPVEAGYTADKKIVGGDTVTPDKPNRSYEVVYTPNGSIVPVDPDGNPIPNTPSVPYETDPHDPTNVVKGKVPEVPGWTPKNGDPVKPSDPTQDTYVPYVHTEVVDGKVPEVPSWTPKNGNQGDPVKPSDPTKDTEVPDDHTMTPGETTVTGKVEGLPEKPAKSAKAPAEKLVKTPVKAPKAVKEASPAEMPAQKAAQAQDQLPQTGEDNSKAAFGLGLASILGGIGILGTFKRKRKEN